MIGFRTSPEFKKLLETQAKDEHRTLSNFIEKCLLTYLKDYRGIDWQKGDPIKPVSPADELRQLIKDADVMVGIMSPNGILHYIEYLDPAAPKIWEVGENVKEKADLIGKDLQDKIFACMGLAIETKSIHGICYNYTIEDITYHRRLRFVPSKYGKTAMFFVSRGSENDIKLVCEELAD